MSHDTQQPLNSSTSTVRDAFDVWAKDSFTVVQSDSEFRGLVELVRSHREIRVIAVTDAQGVLVGVIPIRTIYDALFSDVFPAAALGEVSSVEDAMDVADELVHRIAGELMVEASALTLDETLHDAFIKLHRESVSGMPVIDEDGQPIGYLDHMAIVPLWDQLADA
jgi:CBS domain-containing protein